MPTHLEQVQRVYSAFGQGDIPTILSIMADNVDWHFFGPSDIPFAGQYHGHTELVSFFTKVGQTAEVLEYNPYEFLVGENHVTVLGHQKIRARATGKIWETEFVHMYHFENGQVVKVREVYNTAPMVDALRA